jgi:hypothetical protein
MYSKRDQKPSRDSVRKKIKPLDYYSIYDIIYIKLKNGKIIRAKYDHQEYTH